MTVFCKTCKNFMSIFCFIFAAIIHSVIRNVIFLQEGSAAQMHKMYV